MPICFPRFLVSEYYWAPKKRPQMISVIIQASTVCKLKGMLGVKTIAPLLSYEGPGDGFQNRICVSRR